MSTGPIRISTNEIGNQRQSSARGSHALRRLQPAIARREINDSGRPLDARARAFTERRFGHDFGNVRVHSDRSAADSAEALHARAFTVGRDIVFAAGEYRPHTPAGRW